MCAFDWGGFNLAEDVHRERLASEIAEKGYDLVFGDPLDSLGIEGVGSPEDTREVPGLMKQTGLNKTCAWWLNTHPRKEETKEALNEIAGAWGGKPDSVLLLRMLDGRSHPGALPEAALGEAREAADDPARRSTRRRRRSATSARSRRRSATTWPRSATCSRTASGGL